MQSGRARQKIEGLEDEADFLVANARQFIVVELAHQLAVEPVFALGGRIEAADQVHQRRLSRPRRSHDGHIFAALNAEIHSPKSMNLLLGAHVVGFPKVFRCDHAGLRRRHGHGLRHVDNFGGCHFFLLLRRHWVLRD